MVDLLTSFTVFTKPQQERTYDDQTISSVGEKVWEIIKINCINADCLFKN